MPERMWNYELGIIQFLLKQKMRIELTTFYASGSNLIQVSGQFPDVKYENTGSFKHWGIEFMGSYRITNALVINANYAYLHMEKPLVAAPVNQIYFGITYNWNKFIFHANSEYIGKLYTITNPFEEYQSYLLLGAKVTYQIGKYLSIFIGSDNLLDQQYEINYDYPMPGITVYGGLRLKYEPNK
jgi:iron complex outermembrane receptor protein